MMVEEEDDLRLVLSSSEEDKDDSDSDDGMIQIKNIEDGDSSVEIVETVTVNSTLCEATGEVSEHEFDDDQDETSLTKKQVKTLSQDVAGQMEDGRWFLVKKCEVLIRSLPITLVKTLQEAECEEERNGGKSPRPGGEKLVRGEEGQVKKRSERCKPGLGKQVLMTRTIQAGVSGVQQTGKKSRQSSPGEKQTGTVLRTEGLTDRLSGLVTTLTDRVGMGKEKVRVNRLTRGKKRKLLGDFGMEASDFEVNSDKVVQFDNQETCEEASQDRLELAVAENFINVCRDVEECDEMRTKSDDDCPIDMEDKAAVDPLYSLVKPCYVILQKIDISDCIEISSDCKGTREEVTSIKVTEVDLTRGISLDSLISQEESHPESLDEIALELQMMESSTSCNERSGISLDNPATGVVNSDEEALRRIFENCPVVLVNKSGSNAVSIVKVIEGEAGGDIVPFGNNNASESGEACNGGKIVQVDDEAAIPASRIQEVVTESPDNGRLGGEVVEMVNELNENMLQGAKEKVVPSSNHPDVPSIGETVNMEVSPDDPRTAEELNNNDKDVGKTMAPSEVGSGGEEVEVIDETLSGDIGGMTENLEIVENMKVMNGKPLEKVEEIPDDCRPDQDDKLIMNAPPSSPHDSEPPSLPSSVEILTNESFEDWESVCDTSASEEVNNKNTGVLSVVHSEDFEEDQERLDGNIWRPHDDEVSEKFVEKFSKKPVGADEDDLADKNGYPVPLSSGDEVSGSTDRVLYPHSSSSRDLETFPSRDSSLVGFSFQGSLLDKASSQGSSVVILSSQGSVLVETASEGSSVETSSQASSVLDTSSQASSVVETSPQAVVETAFQASSVVETSSQGSFTFYSDSSSEVSLIEETTSQCSPCVEDGVKGASSVSRADTDSQPGAEAVRQEDTAVIFDDLNLTSNDYEDADDDFLSLMNDVTFDDLSQFNNEIVKSPGQVMEKKTQCQETRSPNASVMLSKPFVVSTRTGGPSSMPAVDESSRIDASTKSVELSMTVDVSIGAVDVLKKGVDATNIGQESEEASNMGYVVEASGIEESSCHQSMKTREINKETKPKKNYRKRSIFDISIDESAVSEAKYKKSSADITSAVSSHSSPKLSSLVKGFAKEIISNVPSSLPCSSQSSTAKSSKEARASCPQSPSITSSTGPTSAPLHSSVSHFEESDSDSSSDDDVIILEESGVSSSNMTHAKASLTPPEKSIKPDRKVPELRPSITNVNVDMWKGLGPGDKPKQSKKEGNHKKPKAKEPTKEINVDKSKTKTSDSQHSKFKTSESRKPKVKVNSKHSQSDSSKSAPKADAPPHTNSKVSALPSLQFKIPKGPSKVPGNSSHSKEMIQCGGKLVRIRNFLKEEDIIQNFDEFLKDDNWQKVESMYEKVTNIKKSASDKRINDIADDAEILDLKSQNLELEKLKTDEERKRFSQSQFKNSVSTDPANNLTFHGFRSLKNKNRTKNLPTESFSIAGGQLLPQPGFLRRNWTEDSKEREAHEKVDKKINLNDLRRIMKNLFVHKFNKKLWSTKSKGRQAELDEFQTYLGHYKMGQEETSNFLTYYNSQKELNLDQVKEVVDLENQYSTFTNYYGEAGDFFCKDCNKRHKFCQ